MTRRPLAAAAIFFALAAAGSAARWLWPAPARLFIDNGTDGDLLVYRDGDPALSVPMHEMRALALDSGAHKLSASGAGGVVDQQALTAGRGHKWIWNVAGKNRYAVYTMTYGLDSAVDGPREVGAGQRLFEPPNDIDAEPLQLLPSTVTVGHNQKSAVARGLYHLPLHADRPCCMEIVKLGGHTK